MTAVVQRVRYRVAYDGAGFSGWQSQRDGKGVQDHVERALGEVVGRSLRIHAAGRTDAGVHALGQIFHADVPRLAMGGRQWRLALNARLPAAIRILSARRVAPDFHARFSATGKWYRYRIHLADTLPPHEAARSWLIPWPLDAGVLDRCLRRVEGTHDFRRFAANRGKPVENAVRTITVARARRRGRLLEIDFEGGGFLYKMVRLLVGSAVQCAAGRLSPEDFEECLEHPEGAVTRHCAPAGGLYLMRVFYGGLAACRT